MSTGTLFRKGLTGAWGGSVVVRSQPLKNCIYFSTRPGKQCISARLSRRDLRRAEWGALRELTEGRGGKSFAKPADGGQCDTTWLRFGKRSHVNVQKHSSRTLWERPSLQVFAQGMKCSLLPDLPHWPLGRLCCPGLGAQPGRGLWSDRHGETSGHLGCEWPGGKVGPGSGDEASADNAEWRGGVRRWAGSPAGNRNTVQGWEGCAGGRQGPAWTG